MIIDNINIPIITIEIILRVVLKLKFMNCWYALANILI